MGENDSNGVDERLDRKLVGENDSDGVVVDTKAVVFHQKMNNNTATMIYKE